MTYSESSKPGIEITKGELVKARPSKNVTGFAPSGKINTHQWGNKPSVFLGLGMEYAESRIYQAGDDVKNIDWRVSARTGQTHTKLFQEERERPVQILLDLRQMMHFGTKVRFKSHLAAEISAKLAWIGHDGGDRVGGQISHSAGISDFKPARSRQALLRFIDAIAKQTQSRAEQAVEEVSLAASIRRLRQHLKTTGLVFIISDFNDLDPESEQELKKLSYRAHVTLIHVIDPFDKQLPISASRLSDGKQTLSLERADSQSVQAYFNAFTQRQHRLNQLCRQHAMVLHQISTSDDPNILFNQTKLAARRRKA